MRFICQFCEDYLPWHPEIRDGKTFYLIGMCSCQYDRLRETDARLRETDARLEAWRQRLVEVELKQTEIEEENDEAIVCYSLVDGCWVCGTIPADPAGPAGF